MVLSAVIFDLDQTLINRDATFEKFIKGQYSRFIDQLPSISQNDYYQTFLKHDHNGYSEKRVMFAGSCKELVIEYLEEQLLEDFLINYGGDAVLFDDALSILESLKDSYRLALITNGRSRGQRSKIKSTGIENYFEVIKISEEEQIKKPNLEIFERCLSDLDLKPMECVYIGDHPENDIQAAKKLGMRAIWRANSNYLAPSENDGIIYSLSGLPNILRKY